MPTRRQRRVSELIHRELSLLLMLEARDPRLAGVTITGVSVTPDLLLARVHFTVLGDAEDEKQALAGLEGAGGFLRTQLAGRVRLRFVPELVFAVDGSSAYGRRIEELLDQLKESDGSRDEGSDAEEEPL
jgi:ribosome-binding factor A